MCPKEKAILRKTERAVVTAMCAQKVVDKKTTEKQTGHVGVEGNYRPVSNSEWS